MKFPKFKSTSMFLKWFILLPVFLFANPQDEAEIRRVLNQFPEDFNAERLEQTCNLFALDSISVYQGTTDRDYEAICNTFRKIIADRSIRFHYEKPQINQIIVDGDHAYVRLIWTLKVTKDNAPPEVTHENGLDVFKRQKDGSWKIVISYAYPN